MGTDRTRTFWLLIALTVAAAPVTAQTQKRLWVLRPPDAIVEYDVASFTPRHTLRVPVRLSGAPEFVAVNAAGQILFRPPKDLQWASPAMEAASGLMWLWDGNRSREMRLTNVPPGGARGRSVLERAPEWWLSAAGDSLYWFENRFETRVKARGMEESVRASARVWRTALAGGAADTIVALGPGAACRCETGVCSETCSEWQFWAPAGGVADVFLLTRWVPGQLGSSWEESRVYRRDAGTWSPRKLAAPLERPLAVSAGGELIAAAELDSGCCGWANESSDRLLLVRGSTSVVIYDEWQRYANSDYDVSFAPANAGFAPGGRLLAYTLVADVLPEGDLRLSADGKANPAELARVRATLRQLPQVDVVQVGAPPRVLATVRGAALVGWLSDRELLVAQAGHLAVYDLRTATTRPTPILVRSAADAFLR